MWGSKNVLLLCQCIVVLSCLDITWVILKTTSNLNFKRSLHLQGGRTSPMTWQCLIQAATILVLMASEKYIWRLKFQQKLPIGNRHIKKNWEKCEKFIDSWTNYQ